MHKIMMQQKKMLEYYVKYSTVQLRLIKKARIFIFIEFIFKIKTLINAKLKFQEFIIVKEIEKINSNRIL